MTQEEFEQVLKEEGYLFKRTGDEILVTDHGSVYGYVRLDSLESLPPGVRFQNQGSVDLDSLENLPPDVRFQNQEDVDLNSLETLPPGVRFENRGSVYLDSLRSLAPGVIFQNQGRVWLPSLGGGWFEDWEGNIKGVNHKRLLNLMIDKGVFL